jgi:hypothetical protein
MSRTGAIWDAHAIADRLEARFRARAAADDLEQAVYGFDAEGELGLHPMIREALAVDGAGAEPQTARAGRWGVLAEQRYPDDWSKPKKSDAKRCDVVLTPAPGPLRDPEVRGTLFDDPQAWDPEEALWLEVKLVTQFTTAGPFRGYAKELMNPVAADVKKLWRDGRIMHAALLLLLWTASRETALHDLQAWHRRCLDRGFPLSLPVCRGFELTDRIGHGWAQIAVFGVRGV